MIFTKRARLVFLGDSITDTGRERPVGESCPWKLDGLGTGYVHMVNALLGAEHPAAEVRVLNVGIAGNTVRDLANRWHGDVRGLEPDFLSVLIGINDIWRQFDTPAAPERSVGPEEYEAVLDRLLGEIRPRLKGLILMTPFVVEKDAADPMRRRILDYGAAVRRLAENHDAVFVDVQKAMDDLLASQHESAVAWDRIHPGPAGHMAIALAFCRATGIVGPREAGR